MKVLSLFDGISCGMVALERINISVEEYVAYEIDDDAIKVSKKNYPNIVHCGDVKKADFTQYKDFELAIAGSPCQGFSYIGNMLNFDDERSVLFFEYARAIKEANPKYFLLENVSMRKAYEDVITKELGVTPIKINSSLVSAQNRNRTYWTNIPNVTMPTDRNIMLQDILEYGNTERKKSKTLRVGGRNSGWGDRHEWDMPNPNRVYTQTELERLQTLPDNYTDCLTYNQSVKVLGNCFTVDVIAHILSFIPDVSK